MQQLLLLNVVCLFMHGKVRQMRSTSGVLNRSVFSWWICTCVHWIRHNILRSWYVVYFTLWKIAKCQYGCVWVACCYFFVEKWMNDAYTDLCTDCEGRISGRVAKPWGSPVVPRRLYFGWVAAAWIGYFSWRCSVAVSCKKNKILHMKLCVVTNLLVLGEIIFQKVWNQNHGLKNVLK